MIENSSGPVLTPADATSPELKTSAVVNDGFGGVFTVGDWNSRPVGFRLPKPDQVLSFPFREVLDAWTSSSGATYLAAKHQKWPIVRAQRSAFERLSLRCASDHLCLSGVAGPTAAADVLYGLAEESAYNQASSCSFHWRSGGVWKQRAIGKGRARAVAVDLAGSAVYLGTGSSYQQPGSLFRWVGGELEALNLPMEASATPQGTSVGGLAAIDGGELLVILSHWDEAARLWRRGARGDWSCIETPSPLLPWLGRVRAQRWRGIIYLPTLGGVFTFDGKAVRRESAFRAHSLWPTALGLICHGSRQGAAAHEIDDGSGWKPFSIPEPDVVFGGRGRVVWLEKRQLPVVKARLPAPRDEAVPARAKAAAKAKPFSLARFLTEVSKREGAKRRRKPLSTVADVERFYGSKLAPNLRAFLAVFAAHQLDGCWIGEWTPWSELMPRSTDSAETLAKTFYLGSLSPYAAVAAFTGTLCLGADSKGDVYYAEVNPRRSSVYLYGHDTGELRLLATSFEAFAALNDVAERWKALCEAEGVDDDALDGDSFLHLTPLRAAAGALKGAVNLGGERSNVSSDFDATLPRLARDKLALKNRSPLVDRCARADWIVGLLSDPGNWNVGPWLIAAEKRSRSIRWAPGEKSVVGSRVYALWHAFLFASAELPRLLSAARKDCAGVARVSAHMFETIGNTKRLPKALADLRKLRDQVRAGTRAS